uniref:Uncharacterized protein n=1 Tax=Oryza brachyantha TaxID=4533 RepID=J3NDW6_ORYBR
MEVALCRHGLNADEGVAEVRAASRASRREKGEDGGNRAYQVCSTWKKKADKPCIMHAAHNPYKRRRNQQATRWVELVHIGNKQHPMATEEQAQQPSEPAPWQAKSKKRNCMAHTTVTQQPWTNRTRRSKWTK